MVNLVCEAILPDCPMKDVEEIEKSIVTTYKKSIWSKFLKAISDFDMYIAHIDFARKYEHMGRHQKALEEYRAAFRIDSRDEGLIEKINYIENKCKNSEDEDKKVNFSGSNLGIV